MSAGNRERGKLRRSATARSQRDGPPAARRDLHLASPLLLCQCHRSRRQASNERGTWRSRAATGIIVRPLRDLRAARAARRDVVRAMQGGGEACAPRAKAYTPNSCRIPWLPSIRGPSRHPRAAGAARALRIAPRRPGPGGWGTYATLVAFGVAVCLTGYLALGELEDASNASTIRCRCPAAARQRMQSRGAGAIARKSTKPTLARASRRKRADGSEWSRHAAGVAEHKSVREPKPGGATCSGLRVRRTRLRAPSRPRGRRDAAAAVAPAPVGGAAGAGACARSPAVAGDRPRRAASARTRWPASSARSARGCSICDGQWGAAPQCPVGVASNNTR